MKLTIDELDLNHELKEGATVSIGRKGFGADIEIDNERISRRHAELKVENGQVKIFDKNSKNHVFVNNQSIAPAEWHTVNYDDKITILGYSLKLVDASPSNNTQPIIQPKPIPESPKKAITPQTSTDLDKRYRDLLQLKLPIKIGRSSTNDVVLPDVTADDKIVGRNHAEIFFKDGKYWIVDLNSKNGTYVNDERIAPGQPRAIEYRDSILVHLHYFSLSDGYRDLRQEVAIRAVGISKTYKNDFVGLNAMSVDIPFKEIVALMGPSGCGKSTLLKALNGDNPATEGNVYIHGLSLRENYHLLKQKIGYVPQDDIIHHELSVEQTLYLAAKLRLPDSTTEEDIKLRITEVLEGLNFENNIRNKKVGSLSGGQRKRICIGVELLSRPTILFLDEPTSPLDPETIEEFLLSLKALAQKGTTIVMVTHKPEDLSYANKVIFMAANGYFVHYGNKEELLEKFGANNIIEVYTKCGEVEFDKEKYYQKPSDYAHPVKVGSDIGVDKRKSLRLQLYWLTNRYFSIKISDKDNLLLLFAQPFIIAGLICFIFHSIEMPVIMLIAVSAIWFGVSNSSKEIVGEFNIYKRERMFNLNIDTYIFSKWIVLSAIALLQVIIFLSIIYLKFDRGADAVLGSFFSNVGYMFYTACSATLFGLFLSSFFNTTEKVLTVVPIALMPQIMLAGVIEPIKNVSVDVLSYFTLGRWGTEGLVRVEADSFSTHYLGIVFYNDKLKNSSTQIVTLFNGMQLNIVAILIINAVMYALIHFSLKKKDTI